VTWGRSSGDKGKPRSKSSGDKGKSSSKASGDGGKSRGKYSGGGKSNGKSIGGKYNGKFGMARVPKWAYTKSGTLHDFSGGKSSGGGGGRYEVELPPEDEESVDTHRASESAYGIGVRVPTDGRGSKLVGAIPASVMSQIDVLVPSSPKLTPKPKHPPKPPPIAP
jgi:hypothetical protein